jgi:hypothetical protein
VKYILLFIFSGITVFLLLQILHLDFPTFTDYDWGYLTGKGILLVLFAGLSVITWRFIRKNA